MSSKGGRPPKPKPDAVLGAVPPASIDMRPPAGMPKEAIELWNEVVPELRDAKVLDRVDRAALKAMCMQWARLEMARRVLAVEGLFARGSMGQLVEHPALAIESKAAALFLRFAEQFGLTASARVRLELDRSGRDPGAEMAGRIGESPRLTAIQGGQGG